MNQLGTWIQRQQPLSLVACCARLLWVLVLAAVPVTLVAYLRSGVLGAIASFVALGICLASGQLALIATALFRGPNVAMWSLLFGMTFRMGLPLVCGILLTRTQPALADASVFGLIMAYYFPMLIAETLLSLRLQRHDTATTVDHGSQSTAS